MRRRMARWGVVVGLLAVVGMIAMQSLATADVRVRQTRLSGANEVPDEGDPDGSGRAKVRINDTKGTVCFRLSWTDIEPPTAAHIHAGAKDVAGDIVVPLFEGALPESISGVKGCVADLDSELLDDIQKNPRQYYVNVHNEEFPAGALRGQLKK
ncbi:MAG TPA: CHRD domain-containing protein [Actinomycetota bacterium]|nr:CHRD domain-containing protein [Actinomycetota bacterium]